MGGLHLQRTALITGGNRGIGFEICRQLGRQGIRVVVGARDPEAGDGAVRRLENERIQAMRQTLDVAAADSIVAAANELARREVTIDLLVNNAGIYPEGDAMAATDDAYTAALTTNTLGPIRCMRAFLPGMVKREFGRVVNVSSGYGAIAEGLEGPAAYSISKAALNAATIKFAAQVPDSVKINACCPGWVRTRMGGADAELDVESGADTPVWLALLPDDGPSGGFFRRRKAIQW